MHAPFPTISKQRAWQLDRIARGLCQCCGAQRSWRKPDGSRGVFCPACRERHNAAKNAANAKRRSAGVNL